jgi:hypothetical protein
MDGLRSLGEWWGAGLGGGLGGTPAHGLSGRFAPRQWHVHDNLFDR